MLVGQVRVRSLLRSLIQAVVVAQCHREHSIRVISFCFTLRRLSLTKKSSSLFQLKAKKWPAWNWYNKFSRCIFFHFTLYPTFVLVWFTMTFFFLGNQVKRIMLIYNFFKDSRDFCRGFCLFFYFQLQYHRWNAEFEPRTIFGFWN